jgi:hypothetical protein
MHSLSVSTSTCLNYKHLRDSTLLTPLSSSSTYFFFSYPCPLLLSFACPLLIPIFHFLFSFSSSAATKKDSLEEVIRNAEGLLSYLESNVETLLQDIDPKGLIQAKIDIAKAGTGAGRGRGRGSGLDGVGVIGEVEEDEVKQDIRKGNTTKLFAFYVPVLSCPVLSCPVLSCPVLSCPVLSCPVLSCPVLTHSSLLLTLCYQPILISQIFLAVSGVRNYGPSHGSLCLLQPLLTWLPTFPGLKGTCRTCTCYDYRHKECCVLGYVS